SLSFTRRSLLFTLSDSSTSPIHHTRAALRHAARWTTESHGSTQPLASGSCSTVRARESCQRFEACCCPGCEPAG
ncbi:unnamed protein product, partial [Ectocarpus fasciculatus]